MGLAVLERVEDEELLRMKGAGQRQTREFHVDADVDGSARAQGGRAHFKVTDGGKRQVAHVQHQFLHQVSLVGECRGCLQKFVHLVWRENEVFLSRVEDLLHSLERIGLLLLREGRVLAGKYFLNTDSSMLFLERKL